MDIVVCFALFLAAMLFCLVKGFSLAWALLFALVLFFALGLRSGYGAKALVKMAWRARRAWCSWRSHAPAA